MKTRNWGIVVPILIGVLVGFWAAKFMKHKRSAPIAEGYRMTAPEAEALEARLRENPDALRDRELLLSYYHRHARSDAESKAAHLRHLLWLVGNAPAAPVLGTPAGEVFTDAEPEAFERVAALWHERVQSQKEAPEVLGNAANFFMHSDRPRALELVQQAEALRPKRARWPARVGRLHRLDAQGGDGEVDQAAARRALEAFRRAYERSLPIARDQFLDDLAKAALASGQLVDATAYAESMLSVKNRQRHSGPFVHDGNALLGRIALMDGDLEEAKRRLLAAGKAETSPTLRSFGPNLALAKALLEFDADETVVAYLESCAQFWWMGREKIPGWIQAIRDGEEPDFGINAFAY